ncbi:MAG: response regulator [Candidatus Methylomirabilales bacterium]
MPRKVVVADNDQLFVALVQEALEDGGYQVFPAFDGMEALDQVRREEPDYIILDLVMPKLDGAEVCRHLKEDPSLHSIPVILVTGTAPEAAHWLKEVKANAFVAKRAAEATFQDLSLILQAFDEGAGPPTWAQEIRSLEELQPRKIVTELLAHASHMNALFQNLGEGILFLDSSQRVIYVNPTGAALLQCQERKLVGTPLSTILGSTNNDPLLQALSAGAAQERSATRRIVYPFRDRTYHVTVTDLLGEGWAAGQLVLIRDTSRLFRRIRELEALNELGTLLTSTLDLDALFRLIMERVQALMRVEASSLLLKDDKTDELVFRIALGKDGHALEGRRLKVGEGISGWVFQQGSPLIIPDVREDHRFYQRVDSDTGFTTKSILCVPLKTHDKVIGVIQVLNGLTKPSFNKHDLNLLSAIAAQAAITIENARLFEQIAKSKREWESTFNAIADGIVLLDERGTVVRANHAFGSWWEIPTDVLIGASWHDLLNRLGVSSVCPHCEAWKTKAPVSDEIHLAISSRIVSLTAFPFQPRQPDPSAPRAGTILIIRDITERKRAEAELEKTRARLQHLLASSPAVIYSNQSSGDFPCTFVSENLHSMIGYTSQEMLDDPKFWPAHLHPQDSPRVLSNVHLLIGEGGGTFEYRFRHREGYYRWIQDSFRVLYDDKGQASEIVGSWTDITERKRAEEALRESNRRLEEALAELNQTQQEVLRQERLRALGKMASGIAHDFNNALMPVLGYSELLLDRPDYLDDKERVGRYLRTMNTAAQDAANVVRRLREFYRLREEDEIFLPVDLNQVVEQGLMLTQPRWKDQALASGITIRTETDLQKVPIVAGNEAELREMLTNLIFNAVDAMPTGGTITIRTHPDNDNVALEISDTGIGMTEEVRQRCLDPFFSTKGERGTGLGLAMVYGILQRHRAAIDIESEPGQGTTFRLRLPVHTEKLAEVRVQEVLTPSPALHVLVVDDEGPVRDVVTDYLTGDGHTVETATNGHEALEKLRVADCFDLVVTDQGMPEMSGDQLAAAIKRVTANKPVILLTGFGDIMKGSGETPTGVDIILSKPVTTVDLRQAIAKVTAGRTPPLEAPGEGSQSHDRGDE